MLGGIPLERILFLDIETVPQEYHWADLDDHTRSLWDKKTRTQRGEEVSASDFYRDRAGIMAEFGKIVCVSFGMVDKNKKLRIASFSGDDEFGILEDFGAIFESPRMKNVVLCAHNGKEFDFPYLARRMLVHGIKPPYPLQLHGKKPWEIPHLDTMELWKFGDRKTYVSLELLAHLFKVPSPKNDIDGSMVASIYYDEKDLDRIVKYCEKDVLTLANVFRRMRQEDPLNPSSEN